MDLQGELYKKFGKRVGISKIFISRALCMCAQMCPPLCYPVTVGYQAPLSMEFFRKKYWTGLSFPSPGGSSRPRDQIHVSVSLAVAGRFFTAEPLGKPFMNEIINKKKYELIIKYLEEYDRVWGVSEQ